MTVAIVLFASTAGYFLQVSPGVVSQGLGGASIVVDEGLPAFHNPAIAHRARFSLIASRWLFSVSMVTASACLSGYGCGLSYIDYGSIQGYDTDGTMTGMFTPFSMCAVISRAIGPFGAAVKGFGERIGTQSLCGACACIGTSIQVGRIGFGAKMDNLGIEFMENTDVPYVIGVGVRMEMSDAVSVIIESKSPDIELNAGLSYRYENSLLLFGVRYLKPMVAVNGFRPSDLQYSGGVMLRAGDYAVGYALILREHTLTHSLCINFSPRDRRTAPGG